MVKFGKTAITNEMVHARSIVKKEAGGKTNSSALSEKKRNWGEGQSASRRKAETGGISPPGGGQGET